MHLAGCAFLLLDEILKEPKSWGCCLMRIWVSCQLPLRRCTYMNYSIIMFTHGVKSLSMYSVIPVLWIFSMCPVIKSPLPSEFVLCFVILSLLSSSNKRWDALTCLSTTSDFKCMASSYVSIHLSNYWALSHLLSHLITWWDLSWTLWNWWYLTIVESQNQ